jgi:hypothetical protein
MPEGIECHLEQLPRTLDKIIFKSVASLANKGNFIAIPLNILKYKNKNHSHG